MSSSVVLTIWYVAVIVLFLWATIDNFKRTKKIIDDYGKALKRELQLINEKSTLMEIIINAKKTKENYFVTLEKIEKELFKSSNNS